MTTPAQIERLDIPVAGDTMAGTLVHPLPSVPGVLFVHGWGGSQSQYLTRAQQVAALGCLCLVFDLRGHAALAAQFETVTREHGLRDVLAAYDALAARPEVDAGAIAVVGSSYGGYLAALLTRERRVRWLALRSPALYRDEAWDSPKRRLDRTDLEHYRRQPIRPGENRALGACSNFEGDVLLMRAEVDAIVPEQVIDNYRHAFGRARSMQSLLLQGADHALSTDGAQQAYTSCVAHWLDGRLAERRAALATAWAGEASPVTVLHAKAA